MEPAPTPCRLGGWRHRLRRRQRGASDVVSLPDAPASPDTAVQAAAIEGRNPLTIQ